MTQTFKVGDVVRLKCDYRYLPAGATGRVSRIGSSWAGAPLGESQVVYLDGDERIGAFNRRFELVSSAFDPKPGDLIKNMRTGREGRVLNGPISKEPKVYDNKPPYRDAVPLAAVVEYEEHYPGTYEIIQRGGPF